MWKVFTKHSLIIFTILLAFSQQVKTANVAINGSVITPADWTVVDLAGSKSYKPFVDNNYAKVINEDISSWPMYYWQAPEPYYQWKIYTYGGDLTFFVKHVVTRGDTSGSYMDEPDLVLEGGPRDHYMKIGYKLLPRDNDMMRGFDINQTIRMPLSEPNWYHLVEEDVNGAKELKLSSTPVDRSDFSLVLAGLSRSLIRAKYHMDQVEGNLYHVDMNLKSNTSRTIECDNDCSGVLLDDLDQIGLLFDEIRRLAPGLKDGPLKRFIYLTNRANTLEEALKKYEKLIEKGKDLIENDASKLNKALMVELMEMRANKLASNSPRLAQDTHRTRLEAERILEDLLKNLLGKISRMISNLNEHGFEPSGMNQMQIDAILRESEMILEELRNRNLGPFVEEADRAANNARLLLEKIRQLLIDPEKSGELVKRLELLKRILDDFMTIVQEQVQKPKKKADELVAEGKKKYEALLALLKEAGLQEKASQKALDEAKRLLDLTMSCLTDEALYLDQLPRKLVDLNSSIHEIEVQRSILTSVNPDYQKKYVDKCRDHSDMLLKKSQELDGLFKTTRNFAEFAVRAATVYKNIAEAIDEAEKAAQRALDAADKAYKMAVPDFDESLADKARESKRKSQELLDRARKLHDDDLQQLSIELAKSKRTIDELFETMKNLIAELDAINAGLKQLADKNLLEQLQDTDRALSALLERIAGIHKRLQLLSDLIYNSIIPQYNHLSAGTESSLGNLGQVIEAARKDLAAAMRYASNSRISLEQILKLEAKLDLDLDLLRRKIQLAHQTASSVHVSIMPDSESNLCLRSYSVPSYMSAESGGLSVAGFHIRQISLTWSMNTNEADSLLLFIGKQINNVEQHQFVALEMYDRHIRFVWQHHLYAPRSSGVLTHPLELSLNDKNHLSDDAWYSIQVTMAQDDRVRLSVRPMSRAHERDPMEVSERMTLQSDGRSERLMTDPFGEADKLNLYVGALALPETMDPPALIKSTRLTGCLYDLTVNEHQVGLWNFNTARGCEACVEGPSKMNDASTFSFSGLQSYSTAIQNLAYDRTKYMVSMSAKTIDASGLLFLSISETSNHYLSIFLTGGGKVAALIGKLSPSQTNYLGLSSSSLFDPAMTAHLLSLASGYNNNGTQSRGVRPLEHMIISNRKYNNNQWFKVALEKDQNRLSLMVDDELNEAIVDDKLLTLDLDQVFFGGAWPVLRPALYTNTSLQFNSFNGCIKDPQIETTPIDLLKRQSHGVEGGCPGSRTKVNQAMRGPYPLPVGRR